MISLEAKSLIKRMLTYDPRLRVSAREALGDTWIVKFAERPQEAVILATGKYLHNMSKFHATNKFKQAVLTFIATQITTQQEREELQKLFTLLDRDGNGTLTKDELIEGYLRVFPLREQAEAEAKKIIEEVDSNNSGKIDFTGSQPSTGFHGPLTLFCDRVEFIVAAMNKEKLLSRQKIEQAFKLFDLVSVHGVTCLLTVN